MNFDDLGIPIFKVIKGEPEDQFNNTGNTSKRMKKDDVKDCFNSENICRFCFKVITKPNQARHIRTCSVRAAGRGDNSKICCVSSKKGENLLTEYKVEDGHYIQHIPNHKQERDIIYISARSGAGKSYYCALFANQYKKLHPKNPIFLFSGLEPEKGGSIEKIKTLKRIKLDENFLQAEIKLEDMANSLLVFDDIDVIEDKIMLNKLYSILKLALQTGRHSKTSVIFTSHTGCNGQQTKFILAEAHSVVLFPRGMGDKPLQYLLGSYFGLNKKQIDEIKQIDSRYITICRSYPSIMFYEGGAKTI